MKPAPRCVSSDDGDVVTVCAQLDDGAAYRVPPSTTSRAALGGPPPAPDVAGAGIFKGKATVGGMCLIPPCPRAMPPMVDFSKLPDYDPEYAAQAREAARLERARQQEQPAASSETGEESISDGETQSTPQP
ncbi:MAG: hypothetical protein AAFX04_09060 [Pseudomonadota bacterium]